MTDLAHWDDPPAQFRLEGPFATRGSGTTEIPGQPKPPWRPQPVQRMESYTIELPLDRAILPFTWRFGGLPDGRTCLTQRIALERENAAAYLAGVQQAFTSGLAPGMNRMAAALDLAYHCQPAEKIKERGSLIEGSSGDWLA